MNKLSLRHIYKIYDNGTKAVNNFNLEVNDNEFIVFVGPSGCGKSTTLRMIAGLEDITAGDFFLEGKLANNLEPQDRDMAMVFQNYALYPHMTVYDNMAFRLRLKHVNKAEIDERVHRAARILDIEDQLNKKPKEMSGGQRQRVALGRAIVRNPKVFLLDEPLSNLDAKLRSSMRSEIMRLYDTLKTTFIYVTHDQVEAMTMGTRIVVMSKGFVQQIDAPMNLYDYPINTFVAGFIGTPQMNFLDGHIAGNEDRLVLSILNHDLVFARSDIARLNARYLLNGLDVITGIRPEHFIVEMEPCDNTLPVEVKLIEKLGNEEILECMVAHSDLKLTVKLDRHDEIKIGDNLYLRVDVKHLHLFDKNSEQTILPRLPESSFIQVRINKDKINLFGQQITLPTSIQESLGQQKKIGLEIFSDAIYAGKEFTLPIDNCEIVNDKYLYRLIYEKQYLYVERDEKVTGETLSFALAFHKMNFISENNEMLRQRLPNMNHLQGKLYPVKKKMSAVNKPNKKKMRKVFDYDIHGYRMAVDEERIEKIYSVLGKKFALHQIEYNFEPKDVVLKENGIPGRVKEVLRFTNHTYLRIAIDEEEILALVNDQSYSEEENVFVQIAEDKLTIRDLNFDVTLL